MKVSFEMVLPVEAMQSSYHLLGVVVHHGHAGGGHYTAFVRASNNLWYHCDDSQSPRWVPVEEVLRAEAYMLFYEK